jgi:hypothetical protein
MSMGEKAGIGDVQNHAEILSSLQMSGRGANMKDGKLLEELSAALNESRISRDPQSSRPILSKQDLIADLEKRYLTPNTKVDNSLLGASQM